MQHNIFAQIRQESNDFYYNEIEVVPGYSFNQYNVIKKAHLYSASRFVNDELYCGRKKVFFNITNTPCDIATKFLNFDTKDIRLIPTNQKSEVGTMLLQKELKNWLKEHKLAKKFNEIAEKAPRYGSVVVKKTKTGVQLVDLRRLINDPTVSTITNSPYVIIQHYYSSSELREQSKNGWDSDKIEQAIKYFQTTEAKESYLDNKGSANKVSSPYIKVWERFGEVPEKWLNGDYTPAEETDKLVKAYYVVAGAYNEKITDEGEKYYEDGVVLFATRWHKCWPLYDYHFKKTEGRWLGVGIVEELFTAQERINEIANQKRIAMELSSKHIFQTSDKTIIRSLLNDVESGAVLSKSQGGDGLVPVANEERNLAAFGSEEIRWTELAQNLTFSFDAVKGENMPSSTPATNAVIQDRNASSIFLYKRENLGIMYRDLFNDYVVPQLIEDLSAEHVLMFTGSSDEFMKLDNLISKSIVREAAMKKLLSGKVVTMEEYQAMLKSAENQLKGFGSKRWIKVKKDLYKNIDMQVDILVTNEQEDAQILSQNLSSVIQSISANPQMLEHPMAKVLFKKYLEMINISPAEIELAEAQAEEMKQMMGAETGGNPMQAMAGMMGKPQAPQGMPQAPQGAMQPPQM